MIIWYSSPCHPAGVAENSDLGGEWTSLVEVDWDRRDMKWVALCPHESYWDCQDSHPHPIFDHADGAVYFTSNKSGDRAVYRVPIGTPVSDRPIRSI